MRHRNRKHLKFNDKDRNHRDAMLRNLLTALIIHKAINTTEKRAHALQEKVDRLFARVNERLAAGDLLNAIRFAQPIVTTVAASKELIRIAPNYKDRKGAVTRATPFKIRVGDGAKLVRLELL
jgi:large subunit ribosomal protein L17